MNVRTETSRSHFNLPRRLLNWYDREGRDLPWRLKGGGQPDPYHVWLSEIMLQQTTVATVAPYFKEFLRRWPTVHELRDASLDDVLHAWQGLGYYARARNLHKCAIEVSERMSGKFPSSVAALRELPGIGPYTASAIAAIAFEKPETVVDGNVERVMSRLYAIEEALPKSKPQLRRHALKLTPRTRSGDYAQALMDLGATICTPRNPDCERCPWSGACLALASANPETYPRRARKAERPTRYGTVFWVEDREGHVLIRRRPEKGLLGGMMEVPSSPWDPDPKAVSYGDGQRPVAISKKQWEKIRGVVTHTFTHFHLILDVERTVLASDRSVADTAGQWCSPNEFHRHAFPTVMKKVIRHVLEEAVR